MHTQAGQTGIKLISKWIGRVLLLLMAIWLMLAQGCMKFRISDKDATAKFQKQGVHITFGDLKFGDRRIHYAMTGRDTCPTLLLLHGSPGSWNAYESYLADSTLRRVFRMVSIDRPGFGYSDFSRAIPITEQVPLVGALMKHLGNRKPYIVGGHSLGGPLAALLAAAYPDQVRGLLLFVASVDPSEELPERWRPILGAFPLYFFLPGAFRPSNTELWAFKQDVQRLPAALQQITCPVLIVHGMKDPLVPPGNADFAQAQLTRSKWVRKEMLPQANHFIPWTRYEVLKSAMLTIKRVADSLREATDPAPAE